MKKALFATLLLLTACDHAAAPKTGERCDLSISFRSYGAGIDGATLTAVRGVLADAAVRSVEMRPWGREGEIDLCAHTRHHGDSERLFRRIRSLIPAAPRGPIDMRTASGLRFETPPR